MSIIRPNNQSATFPLASIGGKTKFRNASAVLKQIEGVKGIRLFFNQTALRIYYDPRFTGVTSLDEAINALRTETHARQDQQRDLSKSRVAK